MRRLTAILSLCLLLAPLVLPVGLSLLGVSEGPQAVEKGRKTPLPEASLAVTDFSAYAGRLVKGFAESFPFRDLLIRTGNRLRMAVYRESPVTSVIMGDDGWLFCNMEMALEDWLGYVQYSPEELAEDMAIMRERRDWLAARGIAMLVVIAPNKATVYGEHMPGRFVKANPLSRLEVLGQAMQREGIPFLDLRQALAEAKAVRRAYWKTDTHWNGWGAFAGSRAVVEALWQKFPAMPPLREQDYQVVTRTVPGGDLSQMMLLEDTITEQYIGMSPKTPDRAKPAQPKGYANPATLSGRDMVIRETGDASLPKAVFFRDSFSSAAWPFLAERFSRSVFLWEHRFKPAIVEAEKPDVVVFEAVERYQHQLFSR